MREEISRALEKAEKDHNAKSMYVETPQIRDQDVHAEDAEPAMFDQYKTKESIRD